MENQLYSVKDVMDYTYYADKDVHEFIFYESSRRSVDAYIDFLDEMIEQAIEEDNLQLESRTIYDLRHSGSQPIMYMSTRTKELVEKYKDLPSSKTYMAILHQDSAIMLIIRTLAQTLLPRKSKMVLKFFQTDGRDNALTWLEETRHESDDQNHYPL